MKTDDSTAPANRQRYERASRADWARTLRRGDLTPNVALDVRAWGARKTERRDQERAA